MQYTEIVETLKKNYRAMVKKWVRQRNTGASFGCLRQNVPTTGLVGFINPATFNAALTEAVIGSPTKGFQVYWEG